MRENLSRHADRLVSNKSDQARVACEDPKKCVRNCRSAAIGVEVLKVF